VTVQSRKVKSKTTKSAGRILSFFDGGLAGTRTPDQCLKRALLYQLSYQPNRAQENKLKRRKGKIFPVEI
jgi:hypothetical protein